MQTTPISTVTSIVFWVFNSVINYFSHPQSNTYSSSPSDSDSEEYFSMEDDFDAGATSPTALTFLQNLKQNRVSLRHVDPYISEEQKKIDALKSRMYIQANLS
jgi:hypothetical protein